MNQSRGYLVLLEREFAFSNLVTAVGVLGSSPETASCASDVGGGVLRNMIWSEIWYDVNAAHLELVAVQQSGKC